MSSSFRALSVAATALLVMMLLVAACATQPAPASPPAQAPAVAPTKAVPAPAPTQAPAAASRVGGTLVYALPSLAYDGLDPQSAGGRVMAFTLNQMGTGLVARDLTTGKFVPYLAESWKVSDDGLTYEFKLRKAAKFHDGTPVTAQDYLYTIQRHRDPATKSPTGERTWGSVASVEAPDDNTLRFKLTAPDSTFLFTLWINMTSSQPLPKHAVEQMGAKFASQPVLSGPFKFKESQVGRKIVLERNPDFNWAPAPHPGPANIQNIEFREVKEYATILAGLETGEIDIAQHIAINDIDRLNATGKVSVVSLRQPGLGPTLVMNTSKAPWDDVRVRKAVNLAIDRQAMIKVVTKGTSKEQRGPLAEGVDGYWPGSAQTGYGYDLNQAKSLMKEAGYTPGNDGILVKDGKPMKFVLKAWAMNPFDQLATMMKEQLKALGIDVEIQQGPQADISTDLSKGNFDVASANITTQPNGYLLLLESFHSSRIGATNFNRINDPKLDQLISAAKSATNEAKALDFAAQAQKLIIENAYSVPLYSFNTYWAFSNRVKGAVLNDNTFLWMNLTGAYIEGGR